MSSLEEHLAQATAEAGELNQTVRNFYTTEKTRIDAQVAGLNAWREGFTGDLPMINLLADSGRFGDGAGVTAGQFVRPEYLRPFNGSSPLVSVGEFIHNNNDYGGALGALTEPVRSLLTDLDVGRRYGTGFHVVEFTQGSGTASSPGNGTALSLTCDSRPLPRRVTFSYFIRARSGGFSVPTTALLDGDAYDGGVITDNRWHHVQYHWNLSAGYDNSFPKIYATAGAVVNLACMSILPGAGFVDPQHIHPIPGADAFWR